MMINKQTLAALKQESYAVITRDPRTAFPEFSFQQAANGWRSGNTLKLDGTRGREPGKVWIYANNPGVIIDYRGEEKRTFWDYFEQLHQLPRKDVLPRLLHFAGLEMPKPKTDANKTAPLDGVHPNVLKTAHAYFQQQLWATQGSETLGYLCKRGYDENTIKTMKLGFIPAKTAIRDHLLLSNIDIPYIDFFLRRISDTVPETHPLVLPCYGKHGTIEGFVFRKIEDECSTDSESKEPPKYLNMVKLNRSAGLLNITAGTDEIIIVEGLLDALIAKAKGFDKVVSLNGARINIAQLDALADTGVKTITLCLDNDSAGKKATNAIVQKIMQCGHEFRVFVAEIPNCHKDIDDVLKTVSGVDIFDGIYQHSITLGSFIGNEFVTNHMSSNKDITPRKRDVLYDRYLHTENCLLYPLDKADFKHIIFKHALENNVPYQQLPWIVNQWKD